MHIILVILLIATSTVYANTPNETIYNCDTQREDTTNCLACNIYHESRSESVAGQVAVGLVTLNRMASKHYPNKVCDVVYELRRSKKTGRLVPMFSWTKDGRHDRVFNEKKWKLARAISQRLLSESIIHDFTLGALWYHRIDVKPFWMKHYHPTVKIGLHQFYADSEETFLRNLLYANYSKTEAKGLIQLTQK